MDSKIKDVSPKIEVEKLQQTRRVYRAAQDLTNKLENMVHHKQQHKVVFEREAIEMRVKLRDLCEKLIFLNPMEFGRKAEEMLWWKVFYSVISAVKKSKKHLRSGSNYECAYRTHLMAAQGFYHHLLLRIQKEFNLELNPAVDFVCAPNAGLSGEEDFHREAGNPRVREWAEKSCHRCLIYLGDLARYQKDLDGVHLHYMAERYYHQALALKPDLGMPHNQLGTLVGNCHEGIDAAYHYMRCWLYDVSFEGAIANLEKSLEKNNKRMKELPAVNSLQDLPTELQRPREIKHFLIHFLHLIEQLQPSININHQKLAQLCQSVLQEFDMCMNFTQDKNSIVSQGVGLMRNGEETRMQFLPEDLVFKMFMLMLMTIHRLRKKGSNKTSMAVVCTLAMFSQLLGHIITRLQKEVDEILHPEEMRQTGVQSDNDEETLSLKPVLDYASPADTLTPSLSQDIDSDGTVRLGKSGQKQGPKGVRPRRRRRQTGDFIKETSDDSDLSEGDVMISSQSDFSSSEEQDEEDPFAVDSDSDYFIESQDVDDVKSKRLHVASSDTKSPDLSKEEEAIVTNLQDLSSKLMTESSGLPIGRRSVRLAPSFDAFSTSPTSQNSLPDKSQTMIIGKEEGENVEEVTALVLPIEQLIEILTCEGLLSTVKLMTDWLQGEAETIQSTAKNSQALWSRYAELLNLFPPALEESIEGLFISNRIQSMVAAALAKEGGWKQPVTLSEDISAWNIPVLKSVHNQLNFREGLLLDFNEQDETLIRLLCLKRFGYYLAKLSGLAFYWDSTKQLFLCDEDVGGCAMEDLVAKQQQEEKEQKALEEERRQKLMKNMAQLRLQSEVHKLEGSILHPDEESLPPYLIPTTEVMTHHLPMIRQLIASGRFVVIIPLEVTSALDIAKKQQVKARDAIKFLEAEFQRGNKYIKDQKGGEKVDLEERKKGNQDKILKAFYTLVECGAHCVEQESANSQHSSRSNYNLVSILTDDAFMKIQNPAMQYAIKLAKEFGVDTCLVSDLYNRWKEVS